MLCLHQQQMNTALYRQCASFPVKSRCTRYHWCQGPELIISLLLGRKLVADALTNLICLQSEHSVVPSDLFSIQLFDFPYCSKASQLRCNNVLKLWSRGLKVVFLTMLQLQFILLLWMDSFFSLLFRLSTLQTREQLCLIVTFSTKSISNISFISISVTSLIVSF